MRKLKRNVRHKANSRQMTRPSRRVPKIPPGAGPEFGSRYGELLRLERKQFSKAGEEERIRHALEALQELRTSFRTKLDLETVKWIAQDPDIMDI
jgi:hypothetical protein